MVKIKTKRDKVAASNILCTSMDTELVSLSKKTGTGTEKENLITDLKVLKIGAQ